MAEKQRESIDWFLVTWSLHNEFISVMVKICYGGFLVRKERKKKSWEKRFSASQPHTFNTCANELRYFLWFLQLIIALSLCCWCTLSTRHEIPFHSRSSQILTIRLSSLWARQIYVKIIANPRSLSLSICLKSCTKYWTDTDWIEVEIFHKLKINSDPFEDQSP